MAEPCKAAYPMAVLVLVKATALLLTLLIAEKPKTTPFEPATLEFKALVPNALLLPPVVFEDKTELPKALLLTPDKFNYKA